MHQTAAIPHFLCVSALSVAEVHHLLLKAEDYLAFNQSARPRLDKLKGFTQLNVFFENSTRTRTSFEIAGKRLGADVINIAIAQSSVSKGESLQDTISTLMQMHPDVIVIRHAASGAPEMLLPHVQASIINAGDGCRRHPTQALLDAFTIQRRFGRLEGLKVAICGDVLHSRVARSNIQLLSKMGAKVTLVAPSSLLPIGVEALGADRVTISLAEGIHAADVVMVLRLQQERMQGGYVPAISSYFEHYGLSHARIRAHCPDAVVMHPGPMNRGVEISSDLADDPEKSLILNQVEHGLATRQAVLDWLFQQREQVGL